MLSIAIPISMQSLITFGVNLMDTIMLGTMGEVALSASSLAGSFYMIYNVFCLGIGCGSGVITAQFWGKRELQPIRDMSSICLKLVFIIGALFTAVTLSFPEQIMRIYTTDPDVIREGARYLRILAVSFVFSGLATAVTQLLRSVNIVKLTLYATIGSFFINIFFNYVFIFGHFGAPRLEVAGAALGTCIARLFEFVVIVGYFVFRDKTVGFRLRHLKGFSRSIFKSYLKAGIPVLISDIIMVVGNNLITIIIGHVGSAFVAANSIATVVTNVVTNLFFGVSNASSIVTGNTIGAGKYREAYQNGITFLTIGFLFGVFGAIVMFFVKMPIINIYNVTEETKLYASQMLIVIALMLPAQVLDHMLTKGILRGGGDTRFLIVGDTVFAYCASAPLGYLAAFVWGLPIWAIYLCLKADTVLKCIMCLWRYFSKKWIKDVTTNERVRI